MASPLTALARKMLGGNIIYPYRNSPEGVPKTVLFNNPVWNQRKDAIAARVRRHQELAHDHQGSSFKKTQKRKKIKNHD